MPDISETLTPNSTQLDNIELRDGARIFTVVKVDVRPGTDQPVWVHFAELDRPWKPGINQRRVLKHCWGRNSDDWIGKRVELFADESVKFGPETPGGTRIRRMSHINGTQKAPVLESKGRPGIYKVEPLPDESPKQRLASLRAEWKSADPERRKVIEAEVAKLTPTPDASPTDQAADQ